MDTSKATSDNSHPMDAEGFETLVKKAFGHTVRRKRKERGLTQEELARGATLHRTYIADIERGARNLSLINIVKIAAGLSTTLTELIRETESNMNSWPPQPHNPGENPA